MTRSARRTGATTKRASQMDTAALADTQLTDTMAVPQAELLDDRTMAIGGDTAASHGRGMSLARSLPGALVGTFLIAGLAFGAALGPNSFLGSSGPKGTAHDSTDADVLTVYHGGGDGDAEKTPRPEDKVVTEPTEKPEKPEPDADATEKPIADGTDGSETDKTNEPEPDKTPKPEKKHEPKPEPKPDPKPKPNPEPLAISVGLNDTYPVIEWGGCGDVDFDYYKVVRSKDSTVAWPTGDNDELIAVVEPGGKRRAVDKHSPDDRKLWYRVFCVRKTDGGYKVLRASQAKGIEVPNRPDPTPHPEPFGLALEASLTETGKVALSWGLCDCEEFAFYKVVRSTSNNPSYLPWTDGSTVLAAIGDVHTTSWLDKPESGDTYYYRVQCLGYDENGKFVLGQSAVVSVTVP